MYMFIKFHPNRCLEVLPINRTDFVPCCMSGIRLVHALIIVKTMGDFCDRQITSFRELKHP
jgi:hypothetical protein